jgi:hypothetical protein
MGVEVDAPCLEERRTLAPTSTLHRRAGRVCDRLHVEPVDALGGQIERRRTITEIPCRHRLGSRRDRPAVVLADEHERKLPDDG